MLGFVCAMAQNFVLFVLWEKGLFSNAEYNIFALATARIMLLKCVLIVQFALSNFWFSFLGSGYKKKKDIEIIGVDFLVETRGFCLSFNITSCVLWLFCDWRYCYAPICSKDLNDKEICQCCSAHVQRFGFVHIYFFKTYKLST